jgi:hypothetical protein
MRFRFVVRLLLVAIVLGVFQRGTAQAATSQIIINQVRTDGTNVAGAPAKEYIELYNASTAAVNLAGWTVEYARSAAKLTTGSCTAISWAVVDPSVNVKEVALSGRVAAKATVLVPITGLLDDKAGSVRVVQPPGAANPTSVVHDMVGWGNAAEPAKCAEQTQAAVPLATQRLVRCIAAGAPSDTNNNAKDFVMRTDAQTAAPTCQAPVSKPTPPPAKPVPPCQKIQISEIVANPKGDDAGREYIELHNTSQYPQTPKDCNLQVGSKTFSITNMQFAADEYRVLYSRQTGLALANTGSEVALVTPTEELAVTYPALVDDHAWAAIDGSWQLTASATPGLPNVFVEGGRGGGDVEESLLPCPPGKFRNPATNRCKTVATATGVLTPCKTGQARNPETNRCRSIVFAASGALTPCNPGQERNPATNRCRSVVAASATLKPCDPGEERNPETNRCRKVEGNTLGTATAAPDGRQEKKMPTVSFAILGGVIAAAVGYGLFEYRTDIRNKLAAVRARIFSDQSGK